MKNPAVILLGTLTLLVAIPQAARAQSRSPYFDQAGEVLLPVDYREDRYFPLIVFLPYTGGTAREQARAFGVEPGEQEGFVLLLPEGSYASSDYLPDFTAFVGWFERRLYADLETATEEYAIDNERIYLAGYSLGGDLAWALSVRNPDDFAGAIVAGSRSSHPVTDDAIGTLSRRDFRAAFLIGKRESRNRYNGINYARNRLERGDVPVFYSEYDGGHQNPPQDLTIEAISYISGGSEPGLQASGSTWPRAPGSGIASYSARGGSGFFSALRSGGRPSDRLRLLVDIPVSFSGYYSSGIGYSGAGAGVMEFESLFDRMYLGADLEIVSSTTTADTYSRRLSSGVSVAFGDDLLLGGGISWDWSRWVSEHGFSDTGSSLGSGTVYRRPRISALALWRDGRRYTPRARVRLSYEIPSTIDPAMAPHLLNGELSGDVLLTDWLRAGFGIGYGTRQRLQVENRNDLESALDRAFHWNLSLGASVSDEVALSLSHRGEHLRALGDNASGPRSGYNPEWRVSLRYSLF